MTILSSASFLDATAIPPYRRSLLRRVFDAAMEGRQRKANAELAKYLSDHRHSLSPKIRAELERCLAGH